MTQNELKKKLKSVWAIQRQLDANLEELQILRDTAIKIVPTYSDMPKPETPARKVEEAVIKIVAMEAAIKSDIVELIDAQQEARELIMLAEEKDLRVILCKRYLNFQKWEAIAADLHYSWQHIHKLHLRGLRAILEKVS